MSAAASGPRPWSAADVRSSGAAVVVGIVLPVWAWVSASNSAIIEDQVGALALGVVGAIATIVGASLWVAGGRHAVSERRRSVLVRLEQLQLLDEAPHEAPAADATAATELVVVAGTRRYHRPGCLLVLGKRAMAADRATAGLEPCEMCTP